MIRYLCGLAAFTLLMGLIATIGFTCEYHHPVIEFTESGGYVGGAWKVLTITSDGTVILERTYTKVHPKLTDAEYSDILAMFSGFDTLAPSYHSSRDGCVDQILFHFILRGDSTVKEVTYDDCGIDTAQDRRPAVHQLKRILGRLIQLSDSLQK